ncbi:MAG: hypothetical protein MR215_02090 [Bacteroidales bacterium]|nr:hypothetical protein [Bacteroidales bacterium]MDD7724572.1 hypothetical protein [Bacteroidales bacterium]MDY4173717.1 hypothetical protein [Bacteroidales bacterium]
MRKKLFAAITASVALAMLTSCGGPKLYPLYNYGGAFTAEAGTSYEIWLHKNEKDATPESWCNLMVGYEVLIQNVGGVRKTPPPGICAEYGYQLLKPGAAATFRDHANEKEKEWFKTDDYETYFRTRGIEMLKKEIELYPESKTFIEPLIEKFTK